MATEATAQEAAPAVTAPAATAPAATESTTAPVAHDAAATDTTHATTEAHGGKEVFPPFDPATFGSQLLWLAITFGALYILMSRVALPRIGGILEDRKSRIDGDLAAADASRQQTDAAIAAYEAALASAKAKANAIAQESRDANAAELAGKRTAIETELSGKVTQAEARIQATKQAALTHVDEIASETAQAVVSQLIGDVSPDTVKAAVAKASKE
ncbi:F0F1 ATP synthase subunit B [Devosia sp.]|uniref:F0F1 ATP synthase subunit B n=1 Tax=Devosia sp. TaxID=1871048 RepID=UPI00326309B3